MIKLNSTIQSRLISTAIGITIILITLGFVININLKNTFNNFSLLSRIDKLNSIELELRKYEKDFLLKEIYNQEFFKTEKSEILDNFYRTLKDAEIEIEYLKNQKVITNLDLYQKIGQIETNFANYYTNFQQLKKLILEKGFKDEGLIGEMREKIHSVETIVEKQNNLYYSKLMLTLRRHEKDYLLRKDLKYKKEFDNVIFDFKKNLVQKYNSESVVITNLLEKYQDIFHRVIENDIAIGLQENLGVMNSINEDITKIEQSLKEIHSEIYKYSKSNISRAVLSLFIMIGILSLLILLIIYRDSRHIVSSIKQLRIYVNKLGKGDLPDEIIVKGTDEISDISGSINILTHNLKQTRDFVIEVGNGHFESEINVFNGDGELGANLINMRKKLLQVSKEREQQQHEANLRIWTNEGIAIFSEILRKNNDNLEELCFQIIKNLIKYLQINQGGIFIKNSEFPDNIYFDLMAAFAYDRKKFVTKKIKLGEGLIGTCAIEAETIYITDIPEDYMEITSGLGGANPTSILIVPIKKENEVLGIIEIASFKEFKKHEIEFVEKIAFNLASHLYFVQMNIKTSQLLEKTKLQADEMRNQEEELRQNIEELTLIQERSATREEELLLEINTLKVSNKDLFRELIEFKKKKDLTEYEEFENTELIGQN